MKRTSFCCVSPGIFGSSSTTSPAHEKKSAENRIQWEVTRPGLVFMIKRMIRKGIRIALTTNCGMNPGVYFSIIKAMPERKYSNDKILVFMTWRISIHNNKAGCWIFKPLS